MVAAAIFSVWKNLIYFNRTVKYSDITVNNWLCLTIKKVQVQKKIKSARLH